MTFWRIMLLMVSMEQTMTMRMRDMVAHGARKVDEYEKWLSSGMNGGAGSV